MVVIGAGVMGAAIAALNSARGIRALLFDVAADALTAARDRIAAELAHDGALPSDGPELLKLPEALPKLGECDLVLESVLESPAAKQDLYRQIEPHLRPTSVLGSNTSTIPIARLAVALARPEAFCGIHFFHPAGKRRLVEVIRGPATSPAALDMTVAYARQLGKIPIVSADSPGFVVNRMTAAYVGEGLELLRCGVAMEAIDRAALAFGMAMGPVRLLDEIGLDTVLRAGLILSEAFPDRALASPILVRLIKMQQLGCKTGAGFYLYADGAATAVNPRACAVIAQLREPQPPPSEAEILDRLLLPMFLEAARMIEERVVAAASDIELGVLHGLGFPAAEGGLLRWAERRGLARILDRLATWTALGPRMTPPDLLRTPSRWSSLFS